jgi:hypothetical protein
VVLSLTEFGHEFYAISDMAVLDSFVVVAEPTQVRAFRLDGTEAWRFGREGDGPQDFRRITDLLQRGDSIALLDPRARRISLISMGGAWVRSIPLGASLLIANVLVPATADRVGIVTNAPVIFDTEAPSGLTRVPQTLRAVRWTDGDEIELLTLPGEETVREVRGQGVSHFRPLFGRSTHVFPIDGSIGVVNGDFVGYEVFAAEGTLLRRVSAMVDLALDPALAEAEWSVREEILGPGPTQGLRDRSPVPDQAPGADAVIASPSGEVWLRQALGEYRRNAGPGPHTWAVFAPDGTWRGTVSTPISFTPMGLSSDRLIGVRRDELDVEHPEIRLRADRW